MGRTLKIMAASLAIFMIIFAIAKSEPRSIDGVVTMVSDSDSEIIINVMDFGGFNFVQVVSKRYTILCNINAENYQKFGLVKVLEFIDNDGNTNDAKLKEALACSKFMLIR